MTNNCIECGQYKIELTREPSYPGQTAPRYCDECFNKCFPNYENKYNKIKLRYRPDGQCFQCQRIKKELMSDDEKPYKPTYIYCDECYDKWYAVYKRKGRYQY